MIISFFHSTMSNETINITTQAVNDTNSFEPSIDMRFNEGHLVSIVTYSVLMVISIAGNTTVLVLICKKRRINRSRINTMLIHLAIADLMVIAFYCNLEKKILVGIQFWMEEWDSVDFGPIWAGSLLNDQYNFIICYKVDIFTGVVANDAPRNSMGCDSVVESWRCHVSNNGIFQNIWNILVLVYSRLHKRRQVRIHKVTIFMVFFCKLTKFIYFISNL